MMTIHTKGKETHDNNKKLNQRNQYNHTYMSIVPSKPRHFKIKATIAMAQASLLDKLLYTL